MYHVTIAIGHWARLPEMKGQYRMLAMLYALATCVRDPFADAPTVHVSHSRMVAMLPGLTPETAKQVGASLAKIGAIKKLGYDTRGVTYQIVKPNVDELDDTARAEATAEHLPSDYLSPPPTTTEPKAPKSTTRSAKGRKVGETPKAAGNRRKEVLAALFPDTAAKERRSKLAAGLAWMAGVSPESIRYGGAEAIEVNAAIDWVEASGTTGEGIRALLTAVRNDADKPANAQRLFLREMDGYRDQVLARTRSGEK